ncbi:MAG: hypothetical protein ACRDT4_07240 [Micromonosporaceae bacterium]
MNGSPEGQPNGRARHSREATESAPAEQVPAARVPAALRIGPRRAVGPVIGAQLAVRLLQEHQPDVLLSEQCGCGMANPCPSRRFATAFVDEASLLGTAILAYPSTSAAGTAAPEAPATESGQEAGPGKAAGAGKQAGKEAGAGKQAVSAKRADSGSDAGSDGDVAAAGRTPRNGRRRPAPRHAGPESEAAPVDLDATQQIPAVPAEPPVAVAV